MEVIGTLTSKGQITIPRDIRENLGLCPGDRLAFRIDRDRNVLMRKTDGKPSLAGSLRKFGKGVTLSEEDIRQAILHGVTRELP